MAALADEPFAPTRLKDNLLVKFFRGHLRDCLSTRERAVQVSMLGRALPEGSRKTLRSSLNKHYEAMTTEHKTPDWVLERATEFAWEWGKTYLKDEVWNPC
jgi:hypothetical protein